MPFADLLPSLVNNQMVMVSSGKVYQPPFPQWYNPNATCAYHGGVPGHSIEQCVALKHKVQSLIDAGWLTFQEDSSNMRTNPLANHGGPAVNAVEGWESRGLKQIGDASTSRQFILEALHKADIVDLDGGRGDSCLIHPGALSDVETCPIDEKLLQGMISIGQIEICNTKKDEGEVCMQLGDRNPSKPQPLVIHFTRDITTQRSRGFQPFIAKTHEPYPYKSDKVVPWKYAIQGTGGRQDTSIVCVGMTYHLLRLQISLVRVA